MAGSFALSIHTPEGTAYEGEALSLVAPGADGQFGILPRHTPMFAAIRPGVLKVRTKDGLNYYATAGGICEINRKMVLLLLDSAETFTEAEPARARAREFKDVAIEKSLPPPDKHQQPKHH